MAWLLKQNKRFAPLLDTALKLMPLLAAMGAVIGILLWTLFSGYLGLLGQVAIPISQAGDWLFLLIFGILATVAVATIVLIPAAWTLIVRWTATAASLGAVQRACGIVAAATLLVLSIAAYAGSQWETTGLAAAIVIGGVLGGIVMSDGRRTWKRVAIYSVGHMCSAFVFITWLALSRLLLSPSFAPFAASWPVASIVILIVLLCALLAAYIKLPPIGLLIGLMLTGFWISQQASPEEGILIASGLYAANLGGGRAARIPQGQVQGEICNLGVEARLVLFYEPEGCDRDKAFKRLRQLQAMGSLARKHRLRQWRMEVEMQTKGRAKS